MKNISVCLTVYNEEKRIENFIKSFLWSDDILVSIRTGTNDKTRELAEKYPVRIVDNPYSNIQEDNALQFEKNLIATLKNEWIMIITASDLIHPRLVKEILDLINDEEFNYNVIKGPGNRHVFGINKKRSPYFAGYNKWPITYKKHTLELTNKVHKELKINCDNAYTIVFPKEEQLKGFSHLTHQTVDSTVERSLRYSKTSEIHKYDDEKTGLKESFKEILKALLNVMVIKKTWLLGWDGIAIMCSYLTYFMLKYLYIWDKFRGPKDDVYEDIVNMILEEWNSENYKINNSEELNPND